MTQQFNNNEIALIQDRACERVGEILDALGVQYEERYDYLQFACPVHGGTSPRSVYWAVQSSHWKCMSRNCEQEKITGPSSSIFGLVRGALTNQMEKPCNFQSSVQFIVSVLGLSNVQMDDDTAETVEVNKAIKAYRKKLATNHSDNRVMLSSVLPSLKPDTVYYPSRGISERIIARYHISYCADKNRPFYNRAFFPILDETGKYILGWSARSIFDKCDKCKLHHDVVDTCPGQAKWRHSKGFKSGQCLYNYWLAKPLMSKFGTAIICEGPGDVWSLEEAGIKNSVALMGLSCSTKQRQLLQKAGALTLVFMLDNDEAGKKAVAKLQKDLMYYFRLFFITPDNVNDIGDMMGEDIKAKILPFMEKISYK